MIQTTLSWIAQQVNGQLLGKDCSVAHVSTDTRSLPAGAVYLALSGKHFDGHDFVSQAEAAGAAAIIASKEVKSALPVIKVEDTHKALGQLAAAVKREVAPKTVAITGSSGKTTVKEMCAAILSGCGKVLATAGNFNNDIGVPLTLLRLERDHQFAVMELGANHVGEIAYTTSLVKPDVATIVNAAASHLEGFGSLFGVATAKFEIFSGLGTDGVAIVNIDSQFADFWLGKLTNTKVLTFSPEQQHDADFMASNIVIGNDGCASFTMTCALGQAQIRLTLPGRHNVGNALLAAALTTQVGATLNDVAQGLAAMKPVKGRLNVKAINDQVRLLDDSYNANVASVKAAIETLASFSGTRVMVLGDMAELGEDAVMYHQQMGEHAKHLGIELFFSLGSLSQHASAVFAQEERHFTDVLPLVDTLLECIKTTNHQVSILVKGSRSSGMERVVAALEEKLTC